MLNKLTYKLSPLILFTLFITTSSNAQEINYGELYPNEDAVTTNLERHLNISERNGKFKISEDVSKTNYYITDKRLSLANESVSYNTFNEINTISAFTNNPLETGSDNNIVSNFTEKDVLIRGIFFNDQKKKNFTYPNIKKGSFTHLKYSKTIKDPHFLPTYVIGQNIPIHNGKFSVTFSRNIDVDYKTFNLDSTKTTFEKTQDDKSITYTWTLKSIPKINRHYDFSPMYYIPQIIIYIKSYDYKGEKIKILSNPSDLYSWYSQLISGVNKNHEELKQVTENLIAGVETDEEKIERIYYFVQNKINYIAFEDGLNGFIPRDALDVYSKKYGDCKDMANILHEMLTYANIPSYLTWIGTREKPYSYYEVPTPITDNHMIAAVKTGDQYTFLDATSKYLTYKLPSPFIQGKEALVGINQDDFKIIKVPEVSAEKNVLKIESVYNLDTLNLSLNGFHNVSLSGFEKLEFLHRLERKEENDLSFLYDKLKFGTKQTEFININYSNLNIKEPTLNIDFETKINGHSRKIGDKIYIKPNLEFNLKRELVKGEAKNFDKKIEYKRQIITASKLIIPENFIIENLPPETNFEDDLFKFTVSYELSEDKKHILSTRKTEVNTLKIVPEEINNWNAFIKVLNKTNKHNIVLKHK